MAIEKGLTMTEADLRDREVAQQVLIEMLVINLYAMGFVQAADPFAAIENMRGECRSGAGYATARAHAAGSNDGEEMLQHFDEAVDRFFNLLTDKARNYFEIREAAETSAGRA